jgi:hypothetical protein
MANTITYAPGKIHIVFDGATAYNSASVFSNGLRITGILFYPSAANDILEVRDGSATGTVISKLISASGGVVKEYFINGQTYKPYIKAPAAGENVWTTAASIRVIFEYD